jgi:tetratricopeptide (TPR) repeat protein
MSKSSWFDSRWMTATGVTLLLIVLFLQLVYVAKQESASWDEPNHIYSGYRSWKYADFGINPEHPPLVKLLAAVPLLAMQLKIPDLESRMHKWEGWVGGRDFVFQNDADKILFRSRLGPILLTVMLALLVFFAAWDMFGKISAFIALGLIAFDPNLIAHGALVTTDVAPACFLFATVYAFYRYAKAPSIRRIILVGVFGGLTLASKHTGILIVPMLALLALCELLWCKHKVPDDTRNAISYRKKAIQLLGASVLIAIISLGVLWASYGFRYSARPGGLELNPPFTQYMQSMPSPMQARVLAVAASTHILPESFIYGLADILSTGSNSFLFGNVYPHGVWFFFPTVFAIKSTLPFLILLVLAFVAIATRRLKGKREILFLIVPPVLYLAVAMWSNTNFGVRHILPIYVFLSVLAAGAAGALILNNRKWVYVFSVLLLFQAISCLWVSPSYMAYANELWGGPANTHNLLTDSNCDWGQQLKSVKSYLDERGVKECWFAYFGEGVLDKGYYGITCKPLPTVEGGYFGVNPKPPVSIDGPVLISAGVLSGFRYGPGRLNPYEQFQSLTPSAVIENSIFVYDGHFEIPQAAARGEMVRAYDLLDAGDNDQALAAAQEAVRLAPYLVNAQMTLMNVLQKLGRTQEAQKALEEAIILAKTVEPEFQKQIAANLEQYLERLRQTQKEQAP